MDAAFELDVTDHLAADAEGWTAEDYDKLVALIELIEESGFESIAGTLLSPVDWFTLEFIEPGETPEMLWAKVFIHGEGADHAVQIRHKNGKIEVDSG